MMTFPFDVTSAAVRPARLVEIVRRDGEIRRIAEAQEMISVDSSDEYFPVAGVEISAIKNALGGETTSLQIKATHSVGGYFDTNDIDAGLYDGAEVTVYAVDREAPGDTTFMFTGTIQPYDYDVSGGLVFDVRGLSIGARTGYIQKYSPMCRVDLFSTLCGLNAASFDETSTIVSITNRHKFVVTMGVPPATGYFNGGVAITQNGQPFVMADWQQSTQTVTAFLPCNRWI